MNAPFVWILFPALLGVVLFFIGNRRWSGWLGGITTGLLSLLAWWLPTDTAQLIGNLSIRLDSTFNLFGRQFSLQPTDQTVLILIFGSLSFWFIGSLVIPNGPRQLVPLGLMISSLLIASLAVTPFLYAALFIQLAVLLSVPLIVEAEQKPGKGLLRFITFQTLSVPLILLAGFLLSGVDAGPGDLALITQASFLLLLGFAFLLAVFPLNAWVPMLAEEAHPYAAGFILTIFPIFSILFGLNFIDRYIWLRESQLFYEMLQTASLLTIVTAGVWVAFQRHASRMMGYASLIETGMALLALSLPDKQIGLQLVFFMIVPRTLAFGIWAMALSLFISQNKTLQLESLQGVARQYPLAAAGLVLACLTVGGLPLLAIFPMRQVLWTQLSAQSVTLAGWFAIGSIGLWFVAFRLLAEMVKPIDEEQWQWVSLESASLRLLLGLGLLGLFVVGIFPQLLQPLLSNVLNIFEHLGQ